MNNTTTEIVMNQFITEATNGKLFDHYRLLEIRQRYWTLHAHTISASDLAKKMQNIEQWMQKIWDELANRLDVIDYGVIAYLIESCQGFTILGE